MVFALEDRWLLACADRLKSLILHAAIQARHTNLGAVVEQPNLAIHQLCISNVLGVVQCTFCM